jgi:WD repeat-containing protein 26
VYLAKPVPPKRKKKRLQMSRPTVQDNLKPGDTPEGLELLAQDVTIFLECLNEFPEFTDEVCSGFVDPALQSLISSAIQGWQ